MGTFECEGTSIPPSEPVPCGYVWHYFSIINGHEDRTNLTKDTDLDTDTLMSLRCWLSFLSVNMSVFG